MTLVLFIVIAVIVLFIIAFRNTPVSIKSHWQTFLDGFQISADEFYSLVKQGLAARQIKQVHIGEQSFLEKHIFSAKRVYMRIIQGEYVIYVCSAPYGTGTFISTWLCIKDERFLDNIPILSKLAGRDRGNKTFYQMDTENMFLSAVHTTVVSCVDSMTEAKGHRGLTELEKQLKQLK